MLPAKSQLTPASYKLPTPVNVTDYKNPNIPERRWELNVDYKTIFYLTDEERMHFLKEVAQGKTIIQVGHLTLTPKMVYMAPIKNLSKEPSDPLLQILNDKHNKGVIKK